MRAIMMVTALLTAVLWVGPASAHGCHHGWQQSASEGWHSHGAKCGLHRGIGVTRKARPQNRRPA